jgi:hypothetical protein
MVSPAASFVAECLPDDGWSAELAEYAERRHGSWSTLGRSKSAGKCAIAMPREANGSAERENTEPVSDVRGRSEGVHGSGSSEDSTVEAIDLTGGLGLPCWRGMGRLEGERNDDEMDGDGESMGGS